MNFNSIDEVADALVNMHRSGYQAVQLVVDDQWKLGLTAIRKAATKIGKKTKDDKASRREDTITNTDTGAEDELIHGGMILWNSIDGARVYGQQKDDDDKIDAENLRNMTAMMMVAAGEQSSKSSGWPYSNIVVLEHADLALRESVDAMIYTRLCVTEQRLVNNARRHMAILMTVGDHEMPDMIKKYVPQLTIPKPSDERIAEMVASAEKAVIRQKYPVGDATAKSAICQSLRGIGDMEASLLLGAAVIASKSLGEETIPYIERAKSDALRRSSSLEYVPRESIMSMAEVAGYELLQEWVAFRRVVMEHPTDQIDRPKGIMLIGPPGTGKSQAGKLMAKYLNRMFIRFDISSVFGSLVGESEARVRDAIERVTAQKGCVLMIDEVDKLLGGAHQASGDSGVTQRILGNILTWMSEKKDNTFVVMTANRMDTLPVELTRKGRIDEVFFVDLPTERQRREIFKIHLQHRKVDTSYLTESDWTRLAQIATGYVGAEIEAAVQDAIMRTYAEACRSGKPGTRVAPTVESLIQSIEASKPMSSKHGAMIEEMRKWGKSHARPVGRAERGHELDRSMAAEFTAHLDD
jgi:hypothetical protein